MNLKDKNETLLKFNLLGDSGFGKTSLFIRYTDDSYSESLLCVLLKTIISIKIILVS